MTWHVQRVDAVTLSGGWMPLRYALGIEAFGVNAWEGRDGDMLTIDHDEVLTGHEELYLVLAGHARFTVNGEEIDAPQGTFVFVRDAGARRSAVATTAGTRILVVGAAPGQPFERSGWEYAAEILSRFDAGEYERALAFAQEVLVDHPADWPLLYWAARSAAKLGRYDEAYSYLVRAIPLEPTVLEYVARNREFEPVRERLPGVAG
jgi:tetratricopeptide (TPR) repeat protein